MRNAPFILFVVLFVSAFSAESGNSDYFFQAGSLSEQKDIIARLSGYSPIIDTLRINDRYSIENRQLCVKYLSSILEKFCSKVTVQLYSKTGNNIWGIVPATSGSSETIVIGAHYDGVRGCPGANDNATGVAAVYSTGKYISSLKVRRYNTIIVFFDEEERGLVGSRAFATMIRSDSVKVHSVHTIDQLGWDSDSDRAIELELPSESLKALYLKVAADNKISSPIHLTKVGSTDHSAFRRIGFNATGITEEYVNGDTTPHYHQPGDTYATVNFDYLQSSTFFLEKVFKYLME
jgi:hypothetical protein